MQYKSNVELHFAAYISEIERLERDRRRVEPISYKTLMSLRTGKRLMPEK
ncbi:MAG: hypothetical protein ABR985_05065 [Methanotrichaceae archaeon]|jgi:hypothetical protein